MERFFSDRWYRVADLAPRLRDGLRIERQRIGGLVFYVLSDPLTGRTHRVDPAGALFLRFLNGRRSVADIWDELMDRLESEAPSQEDVVDLLAALHHADLLDSHEAPDLAELAERRGKQDRALLRQNVMGPMSFRIPLFDPDALIRATLPLVRPLVSAAGFVAWLVLITWAGAGALAEWQTLSSAFADMVWTASSFAIIAVTYVLMKILHEFGHGWTARRFGTPVHEFGIMFLVFMPVPYVDASASAALPSRWQRAAVALAGIVVETTLAALAFFLWRDMEPGPLRAALYNVMLIGGISTLFVNGNPLLKFDGYFVFSDVIGVPNLAQRATKWWGEMVQARLFGAEGVRRSPSTPYERVVFAIYAPLAFAYRVVLSITIALLVSSMLFIVGVILAIWSLTLSLGRPVGKALWHLFTAPVLRPVRGRALAVTGGVTALILGGLFLWPTPDVTRATGVVWMPPDAALRAEEPGRIDRVLAAAGARVRKAAPIVMLDNPLAETRLEALRWRVEELRQSVRRYEVSEPAAVVIARLELEAARRNLTRERQKHDAALLRAGRTGYFRPVRPVEDMPGRYVKAGELLGHVLPARARKVRLVVTQADVDAVERGVRAVEIVLPGTGGDAMPGTLPRPVEAGAFRLPSPALGLGAGGSIATDPSDREGLRSMTRLFQYETDLPPENDAPFGQRVHLRLIHDARPLGLQALDALRRGFLGGFDV
ncbi:PqqD family peptide modification chaperone [Roseovarius sp. MMSF_3281]|uniref:PqqD family peptide modification chaperone n=1 Tax=Roseovarius sp. MMSF_3281 TaxID=3046694 RepID=UPI00273D1831|nr:PqqD family peptide modification chaperone [Roseovarius sp. MMSF_3281]